MSNGSKSGEGEPEPELVLDDAVPCPRCGQRTLALGFGLAGGGYGGYEFCTADGCSYFRKDKEPQCKG